MRLKTTTTVCPPTVRGAWSLGGVGGGEVPIYHDLAFSMYVDGQVAATIRNLEERRRVAEAERRYQYSAKLCAAVSQLRAAGERLGKYEIEKKHAIQQEHYERAKEKKEQAEKYREEIYKDLDIETLLEKKGKLERNDVATSTTSRTRPAAYHTPSPDTSPSPLPTCPPRLPNTPPKPPPSPPRSPSPPPLRAPAPLSLIYGRVGVVGGVMTPRPLPPPAVPTRRTMKEHCQH
ncbi:centrosomal protein of 104 kDa-like isoform X1 [Scylla paramamosain]|uniref:centrosomal protein of 104 kDa-like isoform X1 n=1 Tax=Scylla paramamosain TaxID=85552 RepID=UPI003083E968